MNGIFLTMSHAYRCQGAPTCFFIGSCAYSVTALRLWRVKSWPLAPAYLFVFPLHTWRPACEDAGHDPYSHAGAYADNTYTAYTLTMLLGRLEWRKEN